MLTLLTWMAAQSAAMIFSSVKDFELVMGPPGTAKLCGAIELG